MSDKPTSLSERLNPYLERAIDSYRALWQSESPADAKEFGVFHNACKSALLHIALLKKITTGDASAPPAPVLDWIARARQNAPDESTHDTDTDIDSILMDLEQDSESNNTAAP